MFGRLHGHGIGLVAVAVLTLVAFMPTAVEYAVMLAGIVARGVD